MPRNKGDLGLSISFEQHKAAPTDPKSWCDTKANLTTWDWTGLDGGNYMFDGIGVFVGLDPVKENNGWYRLLDRQHPELASNWEKVSNGGIVKKQMILDQQINNNTKEFTLDNTVSNQTVFFNGVKLREGIGYTISNTTLTLLISSAPVAGNTLDIEYW